MAKKTALVAPEQEQTMADLEAAFAKRDALSAEGAKPELLAEADKDIQKLVQDLNIAEHFDPQEEPVLAKIADLARRRDVLATRLLMQPRDRINLRQTIPPAHPMIDVIVGINGLQITLPRGRRYSVPESIADILNASDEGNE